MTRRSNHAHADEQRPNLPPEQSLDELPLFGGAPAPPPVTHAVPVRAHMRKVSGDAPPSGRERRDAALAGHETREASARALAYVRGKLAELYRSRVRAMPSFPEKHGVTADDADRILREWPLFPRELLELPKQNWRGAIFNPRDWEKTGQSVPAKRGHMNSTTLPLWRLRARVAKAGAA